MTTILFIRDAKVGIASIMAGLLVVARSPPARAEDDADLAKKLSNPVTSLISVPLQSNFDFEIGPEREGFRYTLNVQPVVPISLGADWSMISRTIVPIIDQKEIIPGSGEQFGLGDVTQSLFFSPNTRARQHHLGRSPGIRHSDWNR